MRSLVALIGVLVVAVLIAGCGGGGSSSVEKSSGYPPPKIEPVAEAGQRQHKHHAHRHRAPRQKPEKKQSRAPAGVAPTTAEEFHSFTGTDRENWEIAYEVCGTTPEEQLAREFHTEVNWVAIGHAYGSEEYGEPFNIAPEEGCTAVLKDSQAQWEAAVEELPFKEL